MSLWKRKDRKAGSRPEEWEGPEREDVWEDPFFGRGDPFRDLDDEMRRMRTYMNAMMERALKGDLQAGRNGGPYVYGWSMRVGPDGVPHVQTFGNVKPGMMGARPLPPGEAKAEAGEDCRPQAAEGGFREPLTDVCEDERNIIVIAEMPGIEKEDIELETGEDFLAIKVEKGKRRYYKELELPARAVPNSARAKYNNGVLEITIPRAEEEKKKCTRVKVE